MQQLQPQLNLHTAVVWHVSLKRKIRIACLVDTRKAGKTGVALLFSTDVDLDAQLIVQYYQARCQIEFILEMPNNLQDSVMLKLAILNG